MVLLQAAFWTLVGTSSMLIGTWISFAFRLSSKFVGIIMGFGAGSLIGVAAYELFPET